MDRPYDDARDPILEPPVPPADPDDEIEEEEVRITHEPPTSKIPPGMDESYDKIREAVSPVMTIGGRLAAMEEIRLQIEALTRRLEEHGLGVVTSAGAMRERLG